MRGPAGPMKQLGRASWDKMPHRRSAAATWAARYLRHQCL